MFVEALDEKVVSFVDVLVQASAGIEKIASYGALFRDLLVGEKIRWLLALIHAPKGNKNSVTVWATRLMVAS